MPEKLIQDWPYMEWYANYTWLHKQPLFTWQMALGMKIFGTSLQGMRSASVFMFLLLGVAVYRSITLYYPKAALWMMIIVYITPILLFLVNGRQGMDHNDIAFISWIAIGFWAFVSYAKEKSLKYVLALGAACGAAMLTKWLAGSLLLFTTGLYLLLKKDFTIKSWTHLFIAGSIAALIFLPWQFYQYTNYPDLFLKEWNHNGLHLFEVVEGHSQPWYFHIETWYNRLRILSFLSVAFVLTYFFNNYTHRTLLLTMLLTAIAVILFYSVASTRIRAFTLILIPFVSFLGAAFISSLRKKRIRSITLLIILTYGTANLCKNYYFKREKEAIIASRILIRDFGIELKSSLPENAVIFNSPPMMYPDLIFFSHHLAYEGIPSLEEIKYAKAQGRAVYILTPGGISVSNEIKEQATLVDASYIQFYYNL